MKEPPVRLVICDDHPVVRSGLRAMLEKRSGFEVVGEAADGAEAVELARRHRPDVVLMDLRMPGMNGVEATEGIKAENPHTHVLVLTTYETDADVLRAVEKGATGFLLKDVPPEDLFAAIRNAAQGKSPLAPSVAARLMQRMRGSEEGTLSQREIEILQLVAEGMNNRAIARRLLVSESTVKAHMLHTFSKLGVSDRTAAVTTALKRGIMRLEP